jgi:hypothetical protein
MTGVVMLGKKKIQKPGFVFEDMIDAQYKHKQPQ